MMIGERLIGRFQLSEGRRRLSALLFLLAMLSGALQAGWGDAPKNRVTIRYLCLSHPNSPTSRAGQEREKQPAARLETERVRRFVKAHEGVLVNTEEELLLNLEFGRSVESQEQIFRDAADFQKKHPEYVIQIRFLDPPEWLDQILAEYRHIPANTVLVVQIGDSWEKYFISEGMLTNFGSSQQPIYARRYFYDIRLIWYWKKYVRPEDLMNGQSLLAAVERLKKAGTIPLAIPRARDFDLFWNFYVWLNAAGGRLVTTDTRLGFIPWTEAVIDNESGRKAVDFLSEMSVRGGLALPEASNMHVTDDFLNGNYAMCVMEPWIAWRAKAQLGPNWQDQIGAALLPDIGGTGQRKTFVGGYLLGVMTPSHQENSPAARAGAAWIDYLTNQTDPKGHLNSLQFIPASDTIWRNSEFKPFFDQALGGKDASLPSLLEQRRKTWSPPVLAEGPSALETEEVLSRIAALWHSLERIHSDDPFDTIAERSHRRTLVDEALLATQKAMNSNLSPGYLKRQVWWMVTVGLLLVTLLAYFIRQQFREYQWRKALKERREEIAQMRQGIRDVLDRESEEAVRTPDTTPERRTNHEAGLKELMQGLKPVADTAPSASQVREDEGAEARFEEDLKRLRELIKSRKVSLLD